MKITTICQGCGGKFDVNVQQIHRGIGRFCSKPCAAKHRENARRERAALLAPYIGRIKRLESIIEGLRNE